jgi:surface protein
VISSYNVYDIGQSFANIAFNSATFDASFANYHGLTSLHGFFYNCTSMSSVSGLENLDTNNVTSMGGMFDGCSNLTSLDLRQFNV